jgi:hypothetical protein
VNGRGEGVGEEVRRKLYAVATEPRYAEAAGRFAKKYAAFDPEAQVRGMVERVEELLEQGRGEKGRPGDSGTRGQGAGRKMFAG